MLSDRIHDAVCGLRDAVCAINKHYLNGCYENWYRPTDAWINALIPTMVHTVWAYDQSPSAQSQHLNTLIDLFHPEIKEIAANRDAINAYFSFRLNRDAQEKVLEYFRNNDLDGMKQYIANKRKELGMRESYSYFEPFEKNDEKKD